MLCSLPPRQRLSQLRRHGRWLRLLLLPARLAAEGVGHLRPFELRVHGQEQLRHGRAPGQIRRPAKPASGYCIQPVDVAAILDSTYAAAGFSFPGAVPRGLYSATR